MGSGEQEEKVKMGGVVRAQPVPRRGPQGFSTSVSSGRGTAAPYHATPSPSPSASSAPSAVNLFIFSSYFRYASATLRSASPRSAISASVSDGCTATQNSSRARRSLIGYFCVAYCENAGWKCRGLG